MKNLKKYSDFLFLNEEESSTMSIPTASAKIGGPNYDGKGTIFMPAGKYKIETDNKVKFTIENTHPENPLILSDFLFYPNFLQSEDSILLIGNNTEKKAMREKMPDQNEFCHNFTCEKNGKTTYINNSKFTVSIGPKEKVNFEVSVIFKEDPLPEILRSKSDNENLFGLSIDANVLKGTTHQSDKAGLIEIAWGWNSKVSYF